MMAVSKIDINDDDENGGMGCNNDGDYNPDVCDGGDDDNILLTWWW